MSNDNPLITSAARPQGPPLVPDRKVARTNARAEQRRQTAAARVELAARERLLDLERQRAELDLKRERDAAKRADRDRHRAERQQARARTVAKFNTMVPTIGRRVMIGGPILAPMAVAWLSQIGFALDKLRWVFAGAVLFAAGWELSTSFCGWMYHQARADGDRGTIFRVATWTFAGGAGAINYWHGLDGNTVSQPTPKAVSFGVMSLAGIGLWELYTLLKYRRKMRQEGKLPPARPSFGLVRWVQFPRVTWWARKLAILRGYTTVQQAWSAALTELTCRNKAKAAAKAAEAAAKAGQPPVKVTVVYERPVRVSRLGVTAWTQPPVVWLPTANRMRELAPATPPKAPPTDEQAGARNDRQEAAKKDTGSGGDAAAKKPPTRTRRQTRSGANNRRQNTRRPMDEWVELAGPIFHAELEKLRRQPTGHQFAEAIKNAGLGTVSASTAKNIRTEILDRAPLPSLD